MENTVTSHHSPVCMALVGAGYWGPNLIRNVYENARASLEIVCDLDKYKLEKVKKRYPAIHTTTCYQDLLQSVSIDAIVIATPVNTHYTLARQALIHGKHVLVEKPMCMTTHECIELIALAEEKNLTLMVDHTFVYHGAVQRIKKELDSGELGDLLYFDSVRINLGLFQSDINVVWDLAPHDLSIMDYLIGQPPVSVHATGACHAGNNLEDIAYITVQFENQIIAHFNVSWLSPVKIRQILVGGTQKMILYDDLEPTEKIRIYDKGITVDSPKTDEERYANLVGYRVGDMMVPNLALKEALAVEIEHFIDCVLSGKRPITDGRAGLRVVQILEAANRSIQTGTLQKMDLLEHVV
jgi:predicted dehydrogenase